MIFFNEFMFFRDVLLRRLQHADVRRSLYTLCAAACADGEAAASSRRALRRDQSEVCA